jgi:hypothetical protein
MAKIRASARNSHPTLLDLREVTRAPTIANPIVTGKIETVPQPGLPPRPGSVAKKSRMKVKTRRASGALLLPAPALSASDLTGMLLAME